MASKNLDPYICMILIVVGHGVARFTDIAIHWNYQTGMLLSGAQFLSLFFIFGVFCKLLSHRALEALKINSNYPSIFKSISTGFGWSFLAFCSNFGFFVFDPPVIVIILVLSLHITSWISLVRSVNLLVSLGEAIVSFEHKEAQHKLTQRLIASSHAGDDKLAES